MALFPIIGDRLSLPCGRSALWTKKAARLDGFSDWDYITTEKQGKIPENSKYEAKVTNYMG